MSEGSLDKQIKAILDTNLFKKVHPSKRSYWYRLKGTIYTYNLVSGHWVYAGHGREGYYPHTKLGDVFENVSPEIKKQLIYNIDLFS